MAIILGKETADSIYMPPKKSMIDQYADAFEEFERGWRRGNEFLASHQRFFFFLSLLISVEREAKKAASKKEMFEEPPKENRSTPEPSGFFFLTACLKAAASFFSPLRFGCSSTRGDHQS